MAERSMMLGMFDADVVRKLSERFNISLEAARGYVRKVYDEWRKAGEALKKDKLANLMRAVARRQYLFHQSVDPDSQDKDLDRAHRVECDLTKLLDLYPADKQEVRTTGDSVTLDDCTDDELQRIAQSESGEGATETETSPEESGELHPIHDAGLHAELASSPDLPGSGTVDSGTGLPTDDLRSPTARQVGDCEP